VQHLSAADRSETVLTLAGVAAHRGYLPLTTLIVLAAIGSFIGDQVYFLIGRRFGGGLFARFPKLRPQRERQTPCSSATLAHR